MILTVLLTPFTATSKSSTMGRGKSWDNVANESSRALGSQLQKIQFLASTRLPGRSFEAFHRIFVGKGPAACSFPPC